MLYGVGLRRLLILAALAATVGVAVFLAKKSYAPREPLDPKGVVDVKLPPDKHVPSEPFTLGEPGEPQFKPIYKAGTWWWQKREVKDLFPGTVDDEYGIKAWRLKKLTNAYVRDALVSCGIRDLYGSYKVLPSKDEYKLRIAVWNATLHKKGIDSWLLLADPKDDKAQPPVPSWLETINVGQHDHLPDNLVTKLNERVGGWCTLDVEERFDGVHLDVEPVKFGECKAKGGSGTKCLVRLRQLRILVQRVRQWVVQNEPCLQLTIDVHDWFHVKGRVEWNGPDFPETSAQNWYDAVAQAVNGITVMAYYTDVEKVGEHAEWERTNVNTHVRVGIDWKSYARMLKKEATKEKKSLTLDDATQEGVAQMMGDAWLLRAAGNGPQVDLHTLNDVLRVGGCN